MEKCPLCKTELQNCSGIGPFCPNKDCEVKDGPDLYKKPIKNWPISKCKSKGSQKKFNLEFMWIFVKETDDTTYEEALKEAGVLQNKENPKNKLSGWQYRIWDCRE